MKINFTLLILCFFLVLGNAQKFVVISDNPHYTTFDVNQEGHITVVLKNTTSDSFDMMWDSKLIKGTEWEYYICDINQCYAPFVKECPDDIPNEMAPDKEEGYIFSVNGGGIEGCAVYDFCFWVRGEKEATRQCVELHFNECTDAVSDVKNYDAIKVYPNPASEYFSLTDAESIASIEIYSILGRQVKKFYTVQNGTYNIADLNEGLYITHLINNKGKKVKSMSLRVR